jgi:pyruvate,orthophosphate dikinase
MSRIGVDVPPGFTLITQLSEIFTETGDLPEEVWKGVIESVKRVEQDTGKTYGGKEKPLLFSCRSGAAISMPVSTGGSSGLEISISTSSST